jgi:hypothetical protein
MTLGIRREIDGLEQKMKEDIQTLKHEYVTAACTVVMRWAMDSRQHRDGHEQQKGRDEIGPEVV